jgi:hypothetical protein
MKKHRCFFPAAQSGAAKALALTLVAGNLGCAYLATYTWSIDVEVWFQSDPHDQVYGERWAFGAIFQLGLYIWTFYSMFVVFALIPDPESVGVRYPGDDDMTALLIPGAFKSEEVDGGGGGSGGAKKQGGVAPSRGRTGRYGRERDPRPQTLDPRP